jgi:hypothetical protein
LSNVTTNLSLYKANPVANPTDTFNIDTILNANWDKIDSVIGLLSTLNTTNKSNLVLAINEILSNEGALSSLTTTAKANLVAAINELNTQLSDLTNATVTTPSIAYGMNNKITNTGKTSVSPRFTMVGKTVINLLGKDGNCEDVSKWGLYQITSSLDASNKVFGSNGVKITLTSTSGSLNNIISKYNVDVTKYYLISAYFKNGNATEIHLNKDSQGGGVALNGTYISDSTKFNRVGIVVRPSDLNAGNFLQMVINGASGQYAYVDGIMINEITSSEYALGVTTLLAKYPYVDSYACLQNPYIEVKHDNLVINGNGEEGIANWLDFYSGTKIEAISGYTQVTDSNSGVKLGVYQPISVKPNTSYTVKGVIKCGTIAGIQLTLIAVDDLGIDIQSGRVDINVTSTNDTVVTGTILIPAGCTKMRVIVISNVDTYTGTFFYKEMMLIEGTTPPTSYKPCRLERTVIEGKFTSDDSLVYDKGDISGLINWKHKTLFGKDYDLAFAGDGTGFKILQLATSGIPNTNASSDYNKLVGIQYDGKVSLTGNFTDVLAKSNVTYCDGNGYLKLSFADSDTGWFENINPNADEVKVFMNGWKAQGNNGTRYTNWYSVIDGSLPSIGNIGNATGTNSSGQNTLKVTAIGGIVVGTYFTIIDDSGLHITYGVTAINGTTLTLNSNLTNSINNGQALYGQNDSTPTRDYILSYCKNNVAPGYEGYQLHYKLANPEPITDINTHIHGDVPVFDVGDNYVYVDSGMVLGEVANPFNDGGGNYHINDSYNNPSISSSYLKFKTETINTMYKNLIRDNNWTIGSTGPGLFGNSRAYEAATNFDTNATYTVDYKILATMAPSIGFIGCSYSQDMASVVTDLNDKVESKQNHDSILDTLVDLSMYERIDYTLAYRMCSWISNGFSLWIDLWVPFSPKKTIPVISMSNLFIQGGSGSTVSDVTSKFSIDSIKWRNNSVKISFLTTDTTTINNIRSYGAQISSIILTADCRGRI